MRTLAERLQYAMNKKGLKQEQLANLANTSQVTISNILNGVTSKPRNALELANALDVELTWLLNGEGASNAKFVQVTKSFYYPLLSTVQAGTFTEINLLNHIDGDEQFDLISSQVKAGDQAFFLLIEGDSMTPRFHEGDMVLIDPDLEPKPGKFVAAIDLDGKATFKQYKQLGSFDDYGRPHFKLVPLNDNHPTLSSLEHNIQLIGVAVEHRQAL